MKEKDMWNRLVKLNGEFKEIKKAKKDGQNLFLWGPADNGNLFPARPGTGLGPPSPNINELQPRFVPDKYKLQNRFNTLWGTSSPPPFFANNASNFCIPAQTSSFNRRCAASAPPPTNNFSVNNKQLPWLEKKQKMVIY